MVSQPFLSLDLTRTPLKKCNRDTQTSRTQLLAPSSVVLCFSFALHRCSGFLFPYLPGQPPRDRFRARWAQDEHIGAPTQATSEQFPLQLCLCLCAQHATNGALLAVGDVGLPSISEHANSPDSCVRGKMLGVQILVQIQSCSQKAQGGRFWWCTEVGGRCYSMCSFKRRLFCGVSTL